jgi:hypothetical protein
VRKSEVQTRILRYCSSSSLWMRNEPRRANEAFSWVRSASGVRTAFAIAESTTVRCFIGMEMPMPATRVFF